VYFHSPQLHEYFLIGLAEYIKGPDLNQTQELKVNQYTTTKLVRKFLYLSFIQL
jgi:hypothetical protein